MKILYVQDGWSKEFLSKTSLLENYGITDCSLRLASSADHFSTLSSKMHQHTSNELHLIVKGSQSYQVSNSVYTVTAGHYIMIPADVVHRHISAQDDTYKFTVTFSLTEKALPNLDGVVEKEAVCRAATKEMLDAIANIEAEAGLKKEYSVPLVESKIFQFLLYLARDVGACEGQRAYPANTTDLRLTSARQYIWNNIDRPIKCQEVAGYCHLSQKQLSRLFLRCLGVSIGDYIRSQRIVRVKQFLTESNYSLEQISEKMHFSNVYRFNAFFSKYAGVAPGRFRKMHTREL